MFNNFLCYTRNNVVTQSALQHIKLFFNDLYCDYFDNHFCKIKNDVRCFSNRAIGFCLNNLIGSNAILYLNTNEYATLFSQLELLIAKALNKKVYLLNYSCNENFEISDCEDVNVYIENILKNKNSQDTIFVAYTRNKDNYKQLLKRFKKSIKSKSYVDCLDNVNLRTKENRRNYAAYNKDSTYSTNIFDEVFNTLIKSKYFCLIDSANIYENDFVRLQYMVAKILNKDIVYVTEEDFYNVVNNKISFESSIKKADLSYCDRMFALRDFCLFD